MNTTSLASALDSLFGTISTCDSIFAKNGSTKGLISTANLASVLGDARNTSAYNSVDNLNPGIYLIGPIPGVSTYSGHCLVFGNSTNRCFLIVTKEEMMFKRIDGSWHSVPFT